MKNLHSFLAASLLIISFYSAASQTTGLVVQGSLATALTTTSDNLTLDETHQVVLVNNSVEKTITLPSAIGIDGRQYTIKRIGTAAVNIATQLSQNIDGFFVTKQIIAQYSFLTFVSDGSDWWIIGND